MTFSNANNSTLNLQAQLRGAPFLKSDVANWVKKQWSTMVKREIDQDLLMRQFVTLISFADGKKGDRIVVPSLGRLGVNTKVAGQPVFLQKTPTDTWSITVDQYKEVSFFIEDFVEMMLDPSGLLSSNLAKEASYAIKRDLDAFLLGLRAAVQDLGGTQVIYSSSDRTIGASAVSKPFTLDVFLRAKLALDNFDIPASDRVLIISPTQYTQLLALDKIQSMFYRTNAPLMSGVIGSFMGTPVYMSTMINANSATGFMNGTTAIPTPGVSATGMLYYPTQDNATSLPTTWNTTTNTTLETQQVHTAIYMHKDAFALAMMQEPKTESSRETLYLSDAVVMSTIYGARMWSDKSAVLIHTNSSVPTT